VGIDTAATLLVTAGDNPERLRSEAAWAHLCGVSPLQASSGKVSRHASTAVGPPGNRALWHIVITRASPLIQTPRDLHGAPGERRSPPNARSFAYSSATCP